jgi:geranylgeranyl diphosphate synthase type I
MTAMTTSAAGTAHAMTRDVRAQIEHELAVFLDGRLAALDRVGSPSTATSAFGLLRPYVLDGGKRIRPTLCYWGWSGAGGAHCAEIVRAAAALELFHAFALIHDDIIDGSDVRRGGPSMHRRLAAVHAEAGWRGTPDRFGVAAAILFGDLCLAWADELLHTSGLDPARLRAAQPIYDRMRSEVMCGQFLDVAETARGPSSIQRSLRVVRYKAAKYTVEHPLLLGGTLAGADARRLDSYSTFGVPLGEAFQLRDDLLGVFGDPAATGKSTTDDLREGKPTVLAAYAAEHATPAQRAVIERLHGDPDLDEDGARELRSVLVDTGARAAVENMINIRAGQALDALTTAPLAEHARRHLVDLARAMLWRDR